MAQWFAGERMKPLNRTWSRCRRVQGAVKRCSSRMNILCIAGSQSSVDAEDSGYLTKPPQMPADRSLFEYLSSENGCHLLCHTNAAFIHAYSFYIVRNYWKWLHYLNACDLLKLTEFLHKLACAVHPVPSWGAPCLCCVRSFCRALLRWLCLLLGGPSSRWWHERAGAENTTNVMTCHDYVMQDAWGRGLLRTTEDYWGLLRTTEDYWGLLFEIGLRLECPRSHSRTADNKWDPTILFLISVFPENYEPFGIAVAGRTLAVWSWVPGFVWKLLEPTRYIIMDIGGCKRLCYVVLGNRDLTWLVCAAKLVIECHRLILSLQEAERGWE